MLDNPVRRQFAVAESLLNSLLETRNPLSLIFSGPPGFGKSFQLRKLCQRHGIKWQPIRSSPRGLIDLLKERGNGRAPLVFDDYDEVFRNPRLLEIFKVVLDSHDIRTLSNQVAGPNKIEPFRVTSPAIFLTNKDLRDSSHFSLRVWQTDIPALRDRSMIIQLPFETDAVLDYTLELAPSVLAQVKVRDKRGFDRFLPREQRDELLAHLRDHYERYYEVSPRTVDKFGKLRLAIANEQEWMGVRDSQLRPLKSMPTGSTSTSRRATRRVTANGTGSQAIARARNAGRWHGRGYDWGTDPDLYDELDAEFSFSIDVCASGWNAKHSNFFSEADDGLAQDWGSHTAFMNPPYARALNNWMRKACEAAQRGATVVCLVPAATETIGITPTP